MKISTCSRKVTDELLLGNVVTVNYRVRLVGGQNRSILFSIPEGTDKVSVTTSDGWTSFTDIPYGTDRKDAVRVELVRVIRSIVRMDVITSISVQDSEDNE